MSIEIEENAPRRDEMIDARWFEVEGIFDGYHEQQRHILDGDEAEHAAREICDLYVGWKERGDYCTGFEVRLYPHSCAAWTNAGGSRGCHGCDWRRRRWDSYRMYHHSREWESAGWWPGFQVGT